jgi:plastocyanin
VTLVQSNATLTRVNAQGFSADADEAATTGSVKWQGSTRAYVTEETIRSVEGQRADVLVVTSVIIPANVTPSVSIETGDTVTFTYAGASHTRTVRNHRAALLPGMPSTVKIHFQDA